MGYEVFVDMFVVPLGMAGILLLVLGLKNQTATVVPAVFAGAFLLLYIQSEGTPPFPPIAAKQKVPYILFVVLVLSFMFPQVGHKTRAVLSAVILLVGLLWLIQRPLMAGVFQWKWLLPFCVIPVLSCGVWMQSTVQASRFAWPVTVLVTMITTSLIALLGGFIGIGQVTMMFSVCFGGVVLGVFLDVLGKHKQLFDPIAPAALWAVTVSLGALLILIGSFATNLSPVAYLLTLTILFVPLATRQIAKHPLWRQPFLFAALAAMPAAPAILLAVLNF